MRQELKRDVARSLEQIGVELKRAREHGAHRHDPAWIRLLKRHRSDLIQRLRAFANHPSAETRRRLRETVDSWTGLYEEVRKEME